MLTVLLLSLFINAQENKQVRVAVIDGGFITNISELVPLCSPVKVLKTDINDRYIDHGTNVVGLINKYRGNRDVCFILIASMGEDFFTEAINYANKQNADIINISASGFSSSKLEYNAIKNFLFKDKNRLIFTVAGNNRLDLNKKCNVFPACYRLKRIKVITNNERYANKLNKALISDNDGSQETIYGVNNRGTSQSTAIETGKYLNETN